MSWNFWFVPEPNCVRISPAGILLFLCVSAIPCTICQEEYMLKHSCLRLRRAYILLLNVTAITSKHQKSVKLENQWTFSNLWTLCTNSFLLHQLHTTQTQHFDPLDSLICTMHRYRQYPFLMKTRVSRIFYSRGRVLFLSRLSQAGRWLRTQDCWPRSHRKAWRWWWESRDQGTPGRHGDGVYTWTQTRHPLQPITARSVVCQPIRGEITSSRTVWRDSVMSNSYLVTFLPKCHNGL